MKNILVTIFTLMISGHILAAGIEACPTNKVDKCANVKTQDACNTSYNINKNSTALAQVPGKTFNCIWNRGSCTEKHACEIK